MCIEFNGREICFPLYVEEHRWPPIRPEEQFDLCELVIEDPSWWRAAAAVDTVNQMATEIGGAVGNQFHQAAELGMRTLQGQLPGGVRLDLSARVPATP
jgi:hypothetical protein